MAKTKNLCKWDPDDYQKKLKKLRKLVDGAEYVCTKCGRAANTKDVLCKAEKTGK